VTNEAKAARDEGMARVEDAATEGWAEAMLDLVEEVARKRPRFTSDDVFDLSQDRNVPHTHDLRAFGPVMVRAARKGFCVKANVAPVASRRVSLHASPRAVWDSLIFEGEKS
jgi:hypothetical protein